MSRNIDILRRASLDSQLFRTGAVAATGSGAGANEAVNPGLHAVEQAGRDVPRDDVYQPLVVRQPERARGESLRLVRRLFLSPRTFGAVRVVVFAPAETGEGCSEVTAWTAEMLAAQRTGNVCVVDADMQSPGLHKYFAEENDNGFADFLRLDGSVRRHTRQHRHSNLWLMPAGTMREAAINPERLKACVAELRTEFEYVVINAPSAADTEEAVALGQVTDGVVLVIEATSTRRNVALKAKENLEASHVRVLGAVLNNREFPIPDVIYRKFC